jgi:predicted esterase
VPALRFLFIALLLCATLNAEDLVRGSVAGPLACSTDPKATYAYYLPTHYDASKKWPALFVFDPRSRGAFGAELFQQVAEHLGWIVVSSNDTMSDTDPGPSIAAITAMAGDVPKRFSIDSKRVYATGFSGGAMYAWAFAKSAHLVGVIGCSGRPLGPHDGDGIDFDWFGTAGTFDFNYLPTHEIEHALEGSRVAHRTEYFTGPHRWAPVDMLRRAVEWMELQAMKRGTRSGDDALIERLFREDQERVDAEPDAFQKELHLEAIIRTFSGLISVDAVKAAADQLRSSPEFRRLAKEDADASAYEQKYRTRMTTAFHELTTTEKPSVPWLLHALDIPQLQSIAKESTYRGVAAVRVLETMYSNLHFYLARDFRERGQSDLLNIVLTTASQIHPTTRP